MINISYHLTQTRDHLIQLLQKRNWINHYTLIKNYFDYEFQQNIIDNKVEAYNLVLPEHKTYEEVNVEGDPASIISKVIGKDADGLTMGLQFGGGVEFGKLGIDLRWERAFSGIKSKLVSNLGNLFISILTISSIFVSVNKSA